MSQIINPSRLSQITDANGNLPSELLWHFVCFLHISYGSDVYQIESNLIRIKN